MFCVHSWVNFYFTPYCTPSCDIWIFDKIFSLHLLACHLVNNSWNHGSLANHGCWTRWEFLPKLVFKSKISIKIFASIFHSLIFHKPSFMVHVNISQKLYPYIDLGSVVEWIKYQFLTDAWEVIRSGFGPPWLAHRKTKRKWEGKSLSDLQHSVKLGWAKVNKHLNVNKQLNAYNIPHLHN